MSTQIAALGKATSYILEPMEIAFFHSYILRAQKWVLWCLSYWCFLSRGAIGQPRLLVPVILVMIYNRWNG